jgi:Fe-S-cluster containining protein
MHKLVSQPDPDLCALCHQQGHGCCQASAEGQKQMFGLTQGEIALISQASGLKPDQFCLADQAEPRFLEFLDAIHPVFRQTMPGGRRVRLRLDEDYRCVFLTATGCRLPTAARPLYCRLYPFWVNPYGRLMVLMSDQCLAQQGARSWREVMKRLGQNEADLRRLFARLTELAAQ